MIGFWMALAFALAALRLADLQLIRRHWLMAKADRQQIRAVPVLGRRGFIFDRHGEVLAHNSELESVFVSGRMLAKEKDKGALVAAMASELKLAAGDLRRKVLAGKSFWAKRGAKVEQTARLKKHKFVSLSYEPAGKREYPQGRLAAHVLGFTDVDGRGIEGVEREYERLLAGTPGKKELRVDAKGRVIPSETEWARAPLEGSNITLTLDARLQHIAERELAKAAGKFSPKSASLVLMDPRNGEIIALANWPDFSPSDARETPEWRRRNHAVVDAFEPGSTFKALTAILALEEGVVSPETPVNCFGGKKEYYGRTVRDHGDEHLGVIPFRQVFAQSSNVGTVEVALKLGSRKLYEGARRLGFGVVTGVDLPGEAAGLLRPLDRWTPSSMAAIPFGQELSCNLLHIARLYAAVANGGTLVTPHVTLKISTPSGGDFAPDLAPSGQRVLNESVRRDLVDMLKDVVTRGTATTTALPGFEVAGKTGTAQKYNVALKRYTMHDNVASFVGFAPADKPEYLCVVMLDEPKGVTLGGWTAGPVFRSVMSAALEAGGVNPDQRVMEAAEKRPVNANNKWTYGLARGERAKLVQRVEVPDLIGLKAQDALKRLAKAGLKARVVGQGQVVESQFPEDGEDVLPFTVVKVLMGKKS